MTVLYLSATELQRSASAATVTFAHTAPAGQKGILVGFVRGLTSGAISVVSYGGTTLVQYARATDTATEPGAAEWWYAPHTTTGAQNVAYNQNLPGSMVHVVAISVGGDGTPYVIGAGTKNENTTSHSVSLTTGYVSGMAFGAFYGGAAAPSSLSYATDRVIIHDWDFGAYYSEFFRHANATTAPAYLLGFGGDAPTSDDVAFAAVYLTDGSIAAGAPQTANIPTIAGLAPTLTQFVSINYLPPTVTGEQSTEATALPGVGAVSAQGRAPSLLGDQSVAPAAGAASAQGRAPTLQTELKVLPGTAATSIAGRTPVAVAAGTDLPGTGALAAAGLAPSLVTAGLVAPGVGAVAVAGRAPAALPELTVLPSAARAAAAGLVPVVSTELALVATLEPGVGLVSAGSLAPTLAAEAVAAPGVGAAAFAAQTPTVLPENAIGPAQGSVGASGLAPTLTTEGVVAPGVGAVATSGQAPAIQQSGFFAINQIPPTLATQAAALADTGLVGMQGRAPSLTTTLVALPGVGSVSTQGAIPGLAVEAGVEATAAPGAGSVATQGRQPALVTEALAAPGVGAVSLEGRQPVASQEVGTTAQPGAGAVTAAGLAPALTTAGVARPGAGLIGAQGGLPVAETRTFYPINQIPPTVFVLEGLAVWPDTGTATAIGRQPTIQVDAKAIEVGRGQVSVAGRAPVYGTSALVDFGTPTFPLTEGANLQRFRALVRKTAGTSPLVDIALFENGALVATLVSGTAVTSETGQIVEATWDAALLSDLSGAGVQCFIYGRSSADAYVEIGAVEWQAEVTIALTPAASTLTLNGRTPALGRTQSDAPTTGRVDVVGHVPTLQKFLSVVTQFLEPGAGLLGISYPTPDISFQEIEPDRALLSVTGFAPEMVQATRPGAGAVTAQGLLPTVSALASPDTATLTAAGLESEQWREAVVSPAPSTLGVIGYEPAYTAEAGLGAVSISGLEPSLLTEGTITPVVGALATSGASPELTSSLTIEPAVGLVFTEALLANIEVQAAERTIEPGVGLVTVAGLAPAAAQPQLGGKPIKRPRPRRKAVAIERSLTAAVAVVSPELVPDVPAYWDPPADAMAGFDTAALASRIDTLEQQRATVARRRREEEELILFLLRAA